MPLSLLLYRYTTKKDLLREQAFQLSEHNPELFYCMFLYDLNVKSKI